MKTCKEKQKAYYTIKVSSVPGKWARCRIGVLEIENPDVKPDMISTRGRGVVRVVKTWENLGPGSTSRCPFCKAMGEAEALLESLQNEQQVEDALEREIKGVD